MIENQNGKRILLLGVYGMELVECGGALLKNAKSGGVSHASMLFCGEQMRKDLAKSAEILQTTVEYLNMDSGAVTGSREERLKIATVIRKFKPDIIITQDPEHCVSDLDPGRRPVMNMILDLKQEGAAMVGVFHDEIAIETLADWRYEMRERQMVPIDYKMDYAQEELAAFA